MQPVLSALGLMLVGSRASARASVKVVRRAEWIIFAFLLYAPALTFFVPTPAGVRTRLASLNLVVIVSNAGLVCFGSAKLGLMLEVIRDGLPLGMVLLAYREMGWLGLLHQPLFEIAILIAIATVYGRYQYLADAICGAAIACIVPFVVPARRPNASCSTPDSTLFIVPRTKAPAFLTHSGSLVVKEIGTSDASPVSNGY